MNLSAAEWAGVYRCFFCDVLPFGNRWFAVEFVSKTCTGEDMTSKRASALAQIPSRQTGVVFTGGHLNDPYLTRTRAIQSGYAHIGVDDIRARAQHHTLIISRDCTNKQTGSPAERQA